MPTNKGITITRGIRGGGGIIKVKLGDYKMTKKDFIIIANMVGEIINTIRDGEFEGANLETEIMRITNHHLAPTNPNYDSVKMMMAISGGRVG